MHKEVVISIVIIIAIVILNCITQNYTRYSVDKMSENLEEIRKEIMDENLENKAIAEKASNTHKEWNELKKMLACYLEHDELEKIETELVSMSSYIEKEEYSEALASVDKGVYILEHLREKEKFTLINIF